MKKVLYFGRCKRGKQNLLHKNQHQITFYYLIKNTPFLSSFLLSKTSSLLWWVHIFIPFQWVLFTFWLIVHHDIHFYIQIPPGWTGLHSLSLRPLLTGRRLWNSFMVDDDGAPQHTIRSLSIEFIDSSTRELANTRRNRLNKIRNRRVSYSVSLLLPPPLPLCSGSVCLHFRSSLRWPKFQFCTF